MEDPGVERSSSPSGSEDVDSEGESKQEDAVENGKDSEDDHEGHSKDEDEAEDSTSSDSDDDGSEHSAKSGNRYKSDSEDVRNQQVPAKSPGQYEDPIHESASTGGYAIDVDGYPLVDLPLEVITTVEPTNYAYPVLKNMSNGVLTHRNIFTEFERSVLVGIINKYRNIVDTRSRTREIYLEKQNVWQQIVEEYNGTENIMVRTEKELRKCWDNMKYRAKQAEKEMCKVEVKAEEEQEAVTPEIKMEPLDQDSLHYAADFDGGTEESSWQCSGDTAVEEEREPALKKARQESPKLSSLLLAAVHKRSPSKKVGGTKSGGMATHKSSSGGSSFPYSIPACTKVMHVKKKSQTSAATSNASIAEIPILPKGLASCLSITNIPNPVTVSSHGSGSSLGSHARDSVSPSISPVQASMKPMPSLKKMVPGKHQTSGIGKNSSHRSTRKSNGLSSKTRNHSSAPHGTDHLHGSITAPGLSGMLSPLPGESEMDHHDAKERQLTARLVAQRLEMEQREHEIRMKMLEKELQAHTYQTQYWSLRLKLLRAGKEGVGGPINLTGATNGDID